MFKSCLQISRTICQNQPIVSANQNLIQNKDEENNIVLNQDNKENLEEKKRLDAIIRSVADGLIVMNISHKVILVNSAFRKMIELGSNDIQRYYHDDLLKFQSIEGGLTLEEAEAGG